MSLYNTAYANAINIRSNQAYSEELYTKDPLSGLMERVLPGGGTPGDLPYWIQPQKANIYDNFTRENVELSKTGLVVETVSDGTRRKTMIKKNEISIDDEPSSTGSLLTSSALTFGDLSGNSTYTKVGANNLTQIGARIDKTDPVSTDKMLIYDTSGSSYKTVPWLSYLKQTAIQFNNGLNNTTIGMASTPTTPAITIQNASSSGNRVSISPSNIILDRKDGSLGSTTMTYSAISTASASGTSSSEINLAGELRLKNSGLSLTLDVNRLNELIKLYEKTALASPTADNKMLLWNPTSQIYNYSDIPSGIPSAAPRFRYWKPTEISYSRFVNGGLLTVSTTYSNRTLTMTAPSVVAFQYPSSIGGVGDELNDGDIVYADFSSLPTTNFTTAAKKAIFPITISGGDYDPLVSYPILEALVDIDSKVQISIEPGLYVTPDKPSGTRCNLIIAEFTGGESSYPWFARIPIKVHKKKYNFSDTI